MDSSTPSNSNSTSKPQRLHNFELPYLKWKTDAKTIARRSTQRPNPSCRSPLTDSPMQDSVSVTPTAPNRQNSVSVSSVTSPVPTPTPLVTVRWRSPLPSCPARYSTPEGSFSSRESSQYTVKQSSFHVESSSSSSKLMKNPLIGGDVEKKADYSARKSQIGRELLNQAPVAEDKAWHFPKQGDSELDSLVSAFKRNKAAGSGSGSGGGGSTSIDRKNHSKNQVLLSNSGGGSTSIDLKNHSKNSGGGSTFINSKNHSKSQVQLSNSGGGSNSIDSKNHSKSPFPVSNGLRIGGLNSLNPGKLNISCEMKPNTKIYIKFHNNNNIKKPEENQKAVQVPKPVQEVEKPDEVKKPSKAEAIADVQEEEKEKVNDDDIMSSSDDEVKIWNLRPRKSRSARKLQNKNGGGRASIIKGKDKLPSSPMKNVNNNNNKRKEICSKGGGSSEKKKKEEKKLLTLHVPLTREEIEEDIYALTGAKPSRRPKKRPKNIQKQMDCVFPGLWLKDITPESYNIPESSLKG